MYLDFTKTYDLLMAVRQAAPVRSFLRDRYFPTGEGDMFKADEVLIEYKDMEKTVAPFVVPRKGSVAVMRDRYTVKSYSPPNISIHRPLTIDELNKKQFGEALFPNLSKEERENRLILEDARDLSDMILRREEVMAAEVMQTNGCVMKHIADDTGKVEIKEIHYYDGETNPAAYTPSKAWGTTGATIRQDMAAMIEMLTSRGLPATDFIVSPDVAALMEQDDEIYKMLDNRRYNLGSFEPVELPQGAAEVMQLNIMGRMIRVISYGETYKDPDTGKDTPFISPGTGIITAPGAARMAYASVLQMEDDRQYHEYVAQRVPKYMADVNHDTKELRMTSRPLPIPNNKNPFITAKLTA